MPTGNLVFYSDARGIPAPQGSKKHVGNGRMVEVSKRLKPWRKVVTAQAKATLPEDWEPLDGPLIAEFTFHLPRPTSAPKTRDIPAIRMPDLSKLVRAVEDSLTDAGVWVDDARVISEVTNKRYSVTEALPRIYDPLIHREPGVSIKVYRG